MSTKKFDWFAAPHVSWRKALSIAGIWFAAAYLLSQSAIGTYLDAKIARPIDFRSREELGRSPAINQHLKILSVDDRTYARLGNWTSSLKRWAELLKALDATQPRAIIIDTIFSKIDMNADEGADFNALLQDMQTPVITGSFVTSTPIEFREALALNSPGYDLRSYIKTNIEVNGTNRVSALPDLAQRRDWFAYGPAPALAPVLKHVGHFMYSGDGQIAPLLQINDDKVIPHLALLAAEERRFEAGHLVLGAAPLPMNSAGLINVNFPSPSAWRQSNLSILPFLLQAERGKALAPFTQGDIIVILPLMWTGNADFKPTPLGILPGGYVISAMVNSVLTNNWLKPLTAGGVLFALAALLGALLAIKTSAVTYWIAVCMCGLGGLIINVYLFSYQGIVSPWLMAIGAFAGSSLSVFAEKTRVSEQKVRRLHQALDGALAPDELQRLLKRPEIVSLEARERVVTLMFIDVVGFSLLAENMLPRLAFDQLKRLLAQIGETVHQHGGIIDKTLGDGLLCYFGYRFGQDQSTPDHAEKALRCAIMIQQQNLRRNLEAEKNGEPIYPLRIGINTSSCYLGDLGSGDRIDFTVVGNGVNFTKRLEGACETHSLLFGATTHDLVKNMGLPREALTRRSIRIKHHSEPIEAFEYNPFYLEPELRKAAVNAFRKCANIERSDHRWPVHDASRLSLTCDFGAGQLINFSRAGVSIKLSESVVKGTRLGIRLDSVDGKLRQLLAKEGLDLLHGEVRWAYNDGPQYVHGVMLLGVGDAQGHAFVRYLSEYAYSKSMVGEHMFRISVTQDEKEAS